MTPLAAQICARIARTGPISLAEYMAECLLHPVHGYYTTRDPLGAAGDFTTAPEISQMFGEMLGLCIAQAWLDQGQPARCVLAELGPGRGTLMADVLRATAGVPGFHAAIAICLVEASPVLRHAQAVRVPQAMWFDAVDDLPQAPLFVIANEFFDALPLRQFTREGDAWAETMVGLSEGALTLGRSAPTPLAHLAHRLADTKPGDVIEDCPALPGIVGSIGARIAAHGGAAVFIDYGDWGAQGDTVQAIARHQSVGILDTPGEADLTAHVDFAAIAKSAHPAVYSRLTTQGLFLERLGITARAQKLAQNLTGEGRQSHIAAHRRLTHPSEMGDLFKVMGLIPKGAPMLPGLTP